MKEWKIVIGSPGKIIIGTIKVESNMVDARTLTILNRKISSRSSSEELNLTGYLKLFDVMVSTHNNREYQEFKTYQEMLFRKNDIFYAYDENQPKSLIFQDLSEKPASSDLLQKKSHWFEFTTTTKGNSFFVIRGLFSGFLKHFEDNDFIQLNNAVIEEYYKKEEGIFKLKYDKKSFVAVNTSILESATQCDPVV